MHSKCTKLFAASWFTFLAAGTCAAEPERLGQTFPVTEPPVSVLEPALRAQAARAATAQQEAVRNFVRNLPDAGKVPTAKAPRVRYGPLTVTLPTSLVASDGRTIAAGTQIDVLSHVKLNGFFLFVDARDRRQINFARKAFSSGQNFVPMLTAGSLEDFVRITGRGAYYDYGGQLSQLLGVELVPAIVGQVGSQLRIQEWVP